MSDTTPALVAAPEGRLVPGVVPLPAPAAGEIVLRVRVSGLCGTDLFKLDHDLARGAVLGHEIVGEVEATRSDRFALGDRVVVPHHVPCGECALCRRGSGTLCPTFRDNLLAPGGFAARVVVRARAVAQAAHRVPDGMRDETAVFLEPAGCVLRGIARAELPAGEAPTVAILGAGSMGLLHLLTLRALRPEACVAVVDPLPARREVALARGADAACDPTDAAVAVQALSAGLGADAVFDTVGGDRAVELALGLLREGGTAVLFAHAREGEAAGFALNRLFKHERRLVGTYSGTPAEQAVAWRLLCDGRLDPAPLVTHHLPRAAAAEALALCRRHQALKVLFQEDGER